MALEARQLERNSKKLLVKVEGESCIMEDISRTGLRLNAPVLFKKQVIDIRIEIENLKLDLKGSIRWIHKKPTVYEQVRYEVGVCFVQPTKEYTRLVERLVQE